MPCKNASAFINDCINSIINQSYRNWELIICDDYSTDSSVDVISSLSNHEPRIKLLLNKHNEKPVGIVDALQIAYEESNGFYITRMDADDKMPLNKLKNLVDLLEINQEPSVATGKVSYFPEQDLQLGYLQYAEWLNSLVDQQSHWEEIYKECVIASPAWMMRKRDFDVIGGFNHADYPEDYDLVWRMFINQIKVVTTKEVVHLWRDHPNRTSRMADVYKDQTYFDLKLRYMLSIPHFKNKPITVWGAGKKGKELVKLLLQKNITPVWVCNNANKIGKDIYGITLKDCDTEPLGSLPVIVLVSISNPVEKVEVTNQLIGQGLKKSKDFFILT